MTIPTVTTEECPECGADLAPDEPCVECEEADPDNDEFKCDLCGAIRDIENSKRVGKDQLICIEGCSPKGIA